MKTKQGSRDKVLFTWAETHFMQFENCFGIDKTLKFYIMGMVSFDLRVYDTHCQYFFCCYKHVIKLQKLEFQEIFHFSECKDNRKSEF